MCVVEEKAYTWTFRITSSADGDCGKKNEDMAMRPATTDTTVVKNPNTFWMRTKAECILVEGEWL